MKKRKVTLSLDDKVYVDFQKYCEENAIMLSKKIELFIKEFLKNKKSLSVLFIFLIGLFLINSVSAEIVERGSNWNKIDNGGDSYSLEIYSNIINILNGSDYIPTTPQIEPSNYLNFTYELANAPYKAYFKNNTNTPAGVGGQDASVRFENMGYFFTFDISTSQMKWYNSTYVAGGVEIGMVQNMNPQDTQINISGNSAYYSDAWLNTDLEYKLNPDTMKETLIIRSISNSSSSIIPDYFQYRANIWFNSSLMLCADGVCYSSSSGSARNIDTLGKIEFKDSDNKTIFYLPTPIVSDSIGDTSLGYYSVNLNPSVSSPIILLKIRIPKSFLDSATFPVYVDPSVRIDGGSGGGDARVSGDSPNGNFGSDDELHVKWGTPKDNSYLEFNISSVPSNQVIDSASLCLYLFNDQGSPNSSVYHVYSDWEEDVITWNSQPCGTDFDSSNNCSLTPEDTVFTDGNQDGTWQCWNVTNITRYEYEQSIERISMVLHTWEGGYADKFYSKEYINSSLWPYLNITYHLSDIVAPNLAIISPENLNYNNATILVNLSAEDPNLNTIWWLNGSDNLTYTDEVYYIFQEGSNTIIAYANDSVGNENSSSVSFYVDSVVPDVNILLPQEGVSYGYNDSITLNYSASDLNLAGCWYNLDNGNNITLSNCQNTIFDVSGNGNYVLNLYANDSLGNLGSDSVGFSVQVGAPTIVLGSPIDVYLDSSSVVFSYTPSDIDLNSCELWGNFDGEFKLNQTDNSPVNGSVNTFSLDLDDGTYLWTISCNDSQGNSAFNGNKTFYVDTIAPSIILNEPKVTQTTQTGIPLTFSISDTNLQSCWFNLSYDSGGIWITYPGKEFVLIPNCFSTNFSVSNDYSYMLYLTSNDSAGNLNFTSSSFSVSTSQPPDNPPGGGGSSGSGGGAVGSSNVSFSKLEITPISGMIVDPGETKKITLSVKNIGNKFLNNCKIKGAGERALWITSEGTKGLSAGEEYNFFLTLTIPEKLAAGLYDIELETACQEYSQLANLTAEIIERKLAIDLTNFERNKNNLKISYSLAELSGYDQDVKIEIALFGYNNERIAEITENKTIKANSNENFESSLNIPSSLSGNFNLLINAISETSSTFVQEEIILGSTRTGLAILGGGTGDVVFSIFLVILFAIFAVIILKRIFKLKKLKKNKIELPWKKGKKTI